MAGLHHLEAVYHHVFPDDKHTGLGKLGICTTKLYSGFRSAYTEGKFFFRKSELVKAYHLLEVAENTPKAQARK